MKEQRGEETEQVLGEGRFLRLVRRGGWEYAQRRGISGIVFLVAVTPDERLLLTEQYRVPHRARVLELPAGLAGDTAAPRGEDLAGAASRELLEETGYRAGRVQRLLAGPVSAGFSDEVITLFLATELVREHAGGGDETEDIQTHAVPLAELESWLAAQAVRGVLVDPKIYLGMYWACRHLGRSLPPA